MLGEAFLPEKSHGGHNASTQHYGSSHAQEPRRDAPQI